MNKSLTYRILLVLFLISFIGSLLLSFIPLPEICQTTEGCFTVQNSQYAKTFGISNDYYGDIIFFFMLILLISQMIKPKKSKEFMIALGISFGAGVALYFIYLQIFVLHAFCKYCMIIDSSMILALIIILLPKNKLRSKTKIQFKIED